MGRRWWVAAVQELRLKPALVMWGGFAAISVVLAFWGSVRWAAAHPHGGLGWDEASYVNIALRDLYRWRHEGPLSWARGMIGDDRIRPPAYRILGAPFAITLGGDPFWLRFSSILTFAIAVALLGLTAWQLVRRAAGSTAISAAATVAATVAIASIVPGLLHPIHYFYTESPLFLGTVLVLLGLFWGWGDRDRRSRWAWVVWGLGLALGLLSKASFALMAGGMMAVAFLVIWRRWATGPALWEFVAASALGSAIAAPWWWRNWRAALGYAKFSADFAIHNIGPPGAPVTAGRWLAVALQLGLGLGVTVLLLILAIAALGRLVTGGGRRWWRSPPVLAMGICVAGVPWLPLASIFSLNQNPRLVAPIWIPLVLAAAIALDRLGWTRRMGWAAIAIVPLVPQAIVIFEPLIHRAASHRRPPWAQLTPFHSPALDPVWFNKPIDVMTLQHQWDWTPLMRLAVARGLKRPTIAYFLWHWQLEPPAIQYPWRRDRSAEPPVEQLLQEGSERGELNWDELLERAARHEIVLALQFPDDGAGDNAKSQRNREFIRRFSDRPGYDKPIALPTSADPPDRAPQIIVFFKQ